MFSVYILYSKKLEKYYIGQTNDLNKRIEQHNSLDNSSSTKKGQPWTLFINIDCESRLQAIRIERYIKKMKSRIYIETLKKFPEKIENILLAHKC
jgi:putative endonuclease